MIVALPTKPMEEYRCLGLNEDTGRYWYEHDTYIWEDDFGPEKLPERWKTYRLNIELFRMVHDKRSLAGVRYLMRRHADPFVLYTDSVDNPSERMGDLDAFEVAMEHYNHDIAAEILKYDIARGPLTNPEYLSRLSLNIWIEAVFIYNKSTRYNLATRLLKIGFLNKSDTGMFGLLVDTIDRRDFKTIVKIAKAMINWGYSCCLSEEDGKKYREKYKAEIQRLMTYIELYQRGRRRVLRRVLEDTLPIPPLQDIVIEMAMYV